MKMVVLNKLHNCVPIQKPINEEKYPLDEGNIGHFLSEDDKRKMKDAALELHRLSNQHLKKY